MHRFVGLLRYGGFRATVLLRLGYWAHRNRVPGLPTLLHELNQVLHGIEMTPSVPVGPGLYMPHTVGSVVTAASIGSEVELQGGITIGQRNAQGFPTIEDKVVVACGARILGAITVKTNTTVGANAVLVQSTRPGSVMVGIPAHEIKVQASTAETHQPPVLPLLNR